MENWEGCFLHAFCLASSTLRYGLSHSCWGRKIQEGFYMISGLHLGFASEVTHRPRLGRTCISPHGLHDLSPFSIPQIVFPPVLMLAIERTLLKTGCV
eukprot:174776-Pelagomonas_calceolata.AAC.1